MKNRLTIFFPSGDGTSKNSHCATYKNVKDFTVNKQEGTITFKTQKHGTITTPLPWRLKTNLPAGYVDNAQEDN